MSLMVGDQSI